MEIINKIYEAIDKTRITIYATVTDGDGMYSS